MRTEIVKIYKFNELSDDVRNNIVEDRKSMNNEMDIPFLEENMEEELRVLMNDNGIKGEADLSYSLSNCQGDGVCFTGLFKWKLYHIAVKKINHHYCHKNTVSIDIETNYGNESKIEVVEEFRAIYNTICDKLEKMGYDVIEYQYSDECILEDIEANDFDYLADGTIWSCWKKMKQEQTDKNYLESEKSKDDGVDYE